MQGRGPGLGRPVAGDLAGVFGRPRSRPGAAPAPRGTLRLFPVGHPGRPAHPRIAFGGGGPEPGIGGQPRLGVAAGPGPEGHGLPVLKVS